MEKEIGKVIHWYNKIEVGVIDLKDTLKTGDKIKAKCGDVEFEFNVDSMQVSHKPVDSAKRGDEVAIKFPQKAKEGTILYIEE